MFILLAIVVLILLCGAGGIKNVLAFLLGLATLVLILIGVVVALSTGH